jgi:hypothetical protein
MNVLLCHKIIMRKPETEALNIPVERVNLLAQLIEAQVAPTDQMKPDISDSRLINRKISCSAFNHKSHPVY